VSTFYFAEAGSGWGASLNTFFDAIKTFLPLGTSQSYSISGDLIDVATGELSGTWTDGAGWTVTSSTNQPYVGGTGVRVVWATGGINNGRRVRGSTFLCPMNSGHFTADGNISSANAATIATAANAIVSASGHEMHIYSRPAAGRPGMSSAVISASVPVEASWLRTRRT
jgi:hypothetical protein